MRVVELIRAGSDLGDRATAIDFVRSVASTTGSRPISDHLWLDLRGDLPPGPIIAIASDETGPLAMAQISRGNDAWSLEAFGRPDVTDADTLVLDAAETVLDVLRAEGGGMVYWWVDDPVDGDRAFAVAHGLAPVRSLHEMRRPLPHELQADVVTRSFRPGHDEEAWLIVNNRAFARHGEQGGWTTETLAARMAEPWFDPDGFRLHEIDGRLAAFCWTKLHHDARPPHGEIYVIAVDPDFHGRGLGTQLTLAGLDSIAERGFELANLYVEADNEAALELYRRLGFEIQRTRCAFAGEVRPAPVSTGEVST